MVCGLAWFLFVLNWVCFIVAVACFLLIIPLWGWPTGLAIFFPCMMVCTAISMWEDYR